MATKDPLQASFILVAVPVEVAAVSIEQEISKYKVVSDGTTNTGPKVSTIAID